MGYLGAAYAAGLFFASCFPIRSLLYLLVFAVGVLLLLVWKGRLHWKAAILLAAVFTLSSGWYYGYTATIYQPVMQYAEQETTFTGIVTHQTIYDGDRAGYQLKGMFPDGTRATILCYTKDYGCRYGDELTISGTMTVPSSNYLFAGTAYYKAKSIFLQAANDAVVTYTPTEGHTLQRTLADVRTRMQQKILRLAGTEDGSMMIAMLFGQKQLLNDTLEQAFFRSGIGHVVSVSGFHMVILLLPLGCLGRKRLLRHIRLVMTGLLIGLFSILTESPISILRAGCMVLLAQSGYDFLSKVKYIKCPCNFFCDTLLAAAIFDTGCIVFTLCQRDIRYWCICTVPDSSVASVYHAGTIGKVIFSDVSGISLHTAGELSVLFRSLFAFSIDKCTFDSLLFSYFDLYCIRRFERWYFVRIFLWYGNGML